MNETVYLPCERRGGQRNALVYFSNFVFFSISCRVVVHDSGSVLEDEESHVVALGALEFGDRILDSGECSRLGLLVCAVSCLAVLAGCGQSMPR